MASRTRKRESEFFRKRRAMRERILDRVGVGSDTGQRLLDRWWKQDRQQMAGTPGPREAME